MIHWKYARHDAPSLEGLSIVPNLVTLRQKYGRICGVQKLSTGPAILHWGHGRLLKTHPPLRGYHIHAEVGSC